MVLSGVHGDNGDEEWYLLRILVFCCLLLTSLLFLLLLSKAHCLQLGIVGFSDTKMQHFNHVVTGFSRIYVRKC